MTFVDGRARVAVCATLTLLLCSLIGCASSPAIRPAPRGLAFNASEPREALINGSFEQPRLAHGNWAVFEELPGWVTSFGPGIEIQNNDDLDRPAFDGRQYVELDSHAASGMRQDVTTARGAVYALQFAYAPRPGTSIEDNTIEVLWDGRVIDLLHGTGEGQTRNQWTQRSYRVQSIGERSQLEFRYVGVSNSLGGYLDAITLTALPS